MGKRKSFKGDQCRNCQTQLTAEENYCPNCGQKNDIRRLSISEYISESMGNFFSFDSKIIRSMIPFFIRPGVLSRKYVDGEKAKYVVPFRMYMFFSLIFFLVAGYSKKIGEVGDAMDFNLPDSMELVSQTDSIGLDSLIATARDSFNPDDSIGGFSLDQAILYAMKNPDTPANRALEQMNVEPTESQVKLFDLVTKFIRMDRKEFFNQLLDNAPLIIFLFMPIMALMLKIFYIRRNIYYSEHLTFLLQSNSMIFVLATIGVVLTELFNWNTTFIAFVFFSVYFLIAMRNFYKQSWIKTILKYVLMGFSYAFLLPIFVLIYILMSYYFY